MANADKGAEVLDMAIAKRKAKGPQFPRVWLDDAKTDIDADDIIKRLIGRGSLNVVFGPSGDGKTFFVMDVTGHIVAGIPWRGRRVRRGLGVYVAAEAGTSILRRFCAWRDYHLSEVREDRTPLAIITQAANLLNMVEVEELLAELRTIATEAKLPLALVVFDTLSRSIPGGDENSAEDMTRVIAAADAIRDELGAAVIIVHHSGKDSSKGARGHSSLFAAADTVISVIERVATVDKSRDGTAGEVFPFALDVVDLGTDSDGDAATTCIVRHLDGAAPGRRPVLILSGVAKVALQALGEAVTDHGEIMPETSTIPRGVRAVTMDEWRAQFRIRYGTDKAGGERDREAVKRAFTRAREHLAKAEAVGVSDPYAWVTR
ncbi:MAG: hypothetical protein A2V78_02465 [Betaproteobacteria bacterium RBG_16_64_18]|nr:MAG: hypothetical protein A2V78_02465 [Betaproteobacteria bacterium RBG_16_64_18]